MKKAMPKGKNGAKKQRPAQFGASDVIGTSQREFSKHYLSSRYPEIKARKGGQFKCGFCDKTIEEGRTAREFLENYYRHLIREHPYKKGRG